MKFSYRRLEHDLYWGLKLYKMQEIHTARGFRGKAKGQGFQAYLKAEGIPPRKAYRLIQPYLRVQGILDDVCVANGEDIGLDGAFRWMLRHEDKLKAIRDTDAVANVEPVTEAVS